MDKGGLSYEFEQAADYSVLALKPAMNDSDWSDIEQVGDAVLRDLEAADTPHLIVDLSDLNFIGSAMVALLVRFWKIVKGKNARMVVVVRDPMVLEVLQISRLDQVWEIAEYREDALYELGLSPEAKSERRESNVLVMASVVTALIAAAGLGLYLAKPEWLGIRFTQILAYGCSALGLVLGILLSMKAAGGRGMLGVLSAGVSLAVLVGAFFRVPLSAEVVPAENKSAEQSTEPDRSRPLQNQQSPQTNADSRADQTPAPKSDIVKPAVAEKPASRLEE